jgi:hypothetical protein
MIGKTTHQKKKMLTRTLTAAITHIHSLALSQCGVSAVQRCRFVRRCAIGSSGAPGPSYSTSVALTASASARHVAPEAEICVGDDGRAIMRRQSKQSVEKTLYPYPTGWILGAEFWSFADTNDF